MNRTAYPHPSMAIDRTDDPAQALRVAAAWEGLHPAQVRLTRTDWEQAGRVLDSGQIPLLMGTDGPDLHFAFPDGTAVHIDQRLYLRDRDRCSCRARSCRHRKAVIRALSENRYRRSWRTATLLSATTAGTRADKPVVTALVLGPGSARAGRTPGADLEIRPSRRTAKGTWHRTVTWEAIDEGMGQLPTAQQSVLRTLRQWRRVRTSISLADLGPEFWALLESAGQAGFEIAVEGNLRLAPDQIGVDLHLTQTSGGIVVHAEPAWEGEAAPPEWSLLGTPSHSVLAHHRGYRTLHRITEDPEAHALLRAVDAWVPEADAKEFIGLARHQIAGRAGIHLRETSGTSLIAPPAVRLCARLESRGDDTARLTWGWEYGDPGDPGHTVFGLRPVPEGGRRLGEELQLLETLSEQIPDLGPWVNLDPVHLDPSSACEFLLHVAPPLEEHARTLLHVTGTARALTEEPSPSIHWGITELEDHDWLGLEGKVTVGGKEVSVGQLIHALRSGDRYLVVGGAYLDLYTQPMQELRALLEAAAAEPDQGRLRVSRHDQHTWEALGRLDGITADAAKWQTLVRGVVPVDLSEEPLDEAVQATLRPYQLEGFRWLSARWDAGLGSVLADDMGLGKTLQLLAAIRRHHHSDDRPVLVAAPRSVLGTWAQQAARFTPDLRVRVITERLDGDLDVTATDLVVVSHHLLRLDSERYQAVSWAALIVDEAQAAKNPASRLHRTLRSLQCDVTFVVTGTPVENSLQDLWALVTLAAPGLLPPLKEFTTQWRRPIEKEHDAALLAALRRRIEPVLLRRTKDLVAPDLPPKYDDTLSLQLAPAQVTRYTTALNKERQRVLGLLDSPERHRVEILAALTRLRLLANDPGTPQSPSSKVLALGERLEELAGSGHRALVFSQFTSQLRVVREILEQRGITTAYLDGTTRDRERAIEDFRTGDQSAFLISLKAGGSGLTLTEADYVFIMDPWWNPAVEEQAIDRTHRIGQTSPVTVYRMVSVETIEEKVLALQRTKRELINATMDAEAPATTALDPTQIRALLAA